MIKHWNGVVERKICFWLNKRNNLDHEEQTEESKMLIRKKRDSVQFSRKKFLFLPIATISRVSSTQADLHSRNIRSGVSVLLKDSHIIWKVPNGRFIIY